MLMEQGGRAVRTRWGFSNPKLLFTICTDKPKAGGCILILEA